MTKKDKAHYLNLLSKQKERIYTSLGYLKEDTSGDKAKEFAGIPTHIADVGTDVFERELEMNLSNSEEKIFRMINEAIEKLETKDFGICEECGKKIRNSRLSALPYAKFCIKCQREREKTGE